MEVIDAMNLIRRIDRKRNAVQTLAAHDARETFRMIRLASRPQNTVKNWFSTDRTLFERVQIVLLAVRLPVHSVKRFSLQVNSAVSAREARRVPHFLHRGATAVRSDDALLAPGAHAEAIAVLHLVVHALHQEVG